MSDTAQLVSTIKAHLDKAGKAERKAQDHFIAAGKHLKTLKDSHGGTWAEWEALLKEKIEISTGRASELMQIADGRKTVDQIRDAKAESVRQVRARASLRSEETKEPAVVENDGARDREECIKLFANVTGAERELAQWQLDHPRCDGMTAEEAAEEAAAELADLGGPDGVAALQSVERMSEENRQLFYAALEERYPDDVDYQIESDASDEAIVRTLIEAIGVDRTRALGKNMSALIFKVIGRTALPDCEWCKGTGVMDAELYGKQMRVPCDCTQRKRSEKDFATLRARIERKNAEQQIPQQDFSFGLKVKTIDGRVWASGVRLPTEEEVKFYIDYFARRDLIKHGYKTWEDEPGYELLGFDIVRHAEPPLMRISGGKRKTLHFLHGTCGATGPEGWDVIVGNPCECKMCKERRAFWAQYNPEQADTPEQSAEAMKAKIAALDDKAADGLDIPECLRRDRVS